MLKHCYFLMFLFFHFFVHDTYGIGVFTNDSYLITSFPNIESNKNHLAYTVKSFNNTLYFDFPVDLAPLQNITIFGTISKNTVFVKSSNDILYQNEHIFLLSDISKLRLFLMQKVLQLYPLSGSLIVSLTLGNRKFLNPIFIEYVQSSGLLHLFALSGLHLVIFVSLFIVIFSFLKISYRSVILIVLPLSLFYLLLGGMGISLQRAFLFYFIVSITHLIRIPLLNNRILLIAIILNIILSPSSLFSVSFWLSYGAVTGIVFYYDLFYNFFQPYIPKMINKYFSVSIAVSVIVMPLLILYFKTVNIFSFLLGVITVPVMPFVLVFCFWALLSSGFGIYISLIDNILNLFYQWIYYISVTFSEIPFGVVYFTNDIGKYIVISFFVVISLLLIKKRELYENME